MKPYIQIALSTGHVFEIATQVIAENRAKAMQELHKDEFATLDEALADTVELFEDNYQVRDWALNNMNPEDYMPTARLVRFTPPEQDFNSAEWSHHDNRAMMGELDGQQIMRQPVEAVLSTMAMSNQIANVTVLNGSDGAPFGAMALFIGNQNVIGAYVTAIQFTTERILGDAPAPATH